MFERQKQLQIRFNAFLSKMLSKSLFSRYSSKSEISQFTSSMPPRKFPHPHHPSQIFIPPVWLSHHQQHLLPAAFPASVSPSIHCNKHISTHFHLFLEVFKQHYIKYIFTLNNTILYANIQIYIV